MIDASSINDNDGVVSDDTFNIGRAATPSSELIGCRQKALAVLLHLQTTRTAYADLTKGTKAYQGLRGSPFLVAQKTPDRKFSKSMDREKMTWLNMPLCGSKSQADGGSATPRITRITGWTISHALSMTTTASCTKLAANRSRADTYAIYRELQCITLRRRFSGSTSEQTSSREWLEVLLSVRAETSASLGPNMPHRSNAFLKTRNSLERSELCQLARNALELDAQFAACLLVAEYSFANVSLSGVLDHIPLAAH
ncbi:uncharacterized protein K460DRAFT_403347 [Cucurbitaria berberidis CBS 394.84]|uniref:Uncharacterized protein n=1 Tax=Cucurbitaria berberidis CBS 394.84 TaxID=1168544 RepID=A0A9P4LA60_9PLEO|nr:uncharacterized protein K460DRAFT_403347 [Cucurbitaria berberidis CBS 394.84]KAF1848046.1 hypothetical protein K460DRAFT_403347 [Cucurbitaria berberidis CBS 394.84]